MVTASDASEPGGGVTTSTGLTQRGREKLQEFGHLANGVVEDRLLLVEHCCGIGAGHRALEGQRPGGHLVTEVDDAAIRVMETAWPGVSMQGVLREFTEEKVEGWRKPHDRS